MAAAPALRAEDLWKTYRIHAPPPAGAPPAPWWRAGLGRRPRVPFHALQGLSFEVPEGAVLGVVGANGAGKSTLLRVLSRITDPSRGCVRVRGRVASLLEVGTGFHPELTGLENIHLNAALHGLSRRDVRARLPGILAYAEIGDFLHEPVKRYSSGMYLRLAFSIAAHLEPDILIVDELLAVGDAAFRARCLGTLEGAAGSGRTVVLVSHDATTLRALCTQALHLERGALVASGPADEVVTGYLARLGAGRGLVHADTGALAVSDVAGRVEPADGGTAPGAPSGAPPAASPAAMCRVVWSFALTARRALPDLHVDLSLEGPSGVCLLQVLSSARGEPPLRLAAGERVRLEAECLLPPLPPGAYTAGLSAHTRGDIHLHATGLPLFTHPAPPSAPESLAPAFHAALLPRTTVRVRRLPDA